MYSRHSSWILSDKLVLCHVSIRTGQMNRINTHLLWSFFKIFGKSLGRRILNGYVRRKILIVIIIEYELQSGIIIIIYLSYPSKYSKIIRTCDVMGWFNWHIQIIFQWMSIAQFATIRRWRAKLSNLRHRNRRLHSAWNKGICRQEIDESEPRAQVTRKKSRPIDKGTNEISIGRDEVASNN